MSYLPVQVSNKRSKQLLREARYAFFHRIDEEGLHWIKAAMKDGADLMESYGLEPRDN